MAAILRTEGLSKDFGSFRAVSDLSLDVEEGDIYGFLGLNGAGKTTTIRMLLRLIRPTAGRITIFGRDIRTEFIPIMQQVGSLVELPAYYPYLSAVKNLEILRLATGGVPRSRIGEVLEIVGLWDRRNGPVSRYSQGMRQRLGIAMALLPSPKLILLDEPTNGLDPHGINHIREVIKTLNRKEGVTFLISSHLLHEVEITCNRIGIVKAGKLMLQDTVKRILARTVTGLSVFCDPVPAAIRLLQEQSWVEAVEEDETGGLRVRCEPEHFSKVNRLLMENGVSVGELTPLRQTLEDFFLTQ